MEQYEIYIKIKESTIASGVDLKIVDAIIKKMLTALDPEQLEIFEDFKISKTILEINANTFEEFNKKNEENNNGK